MAVSIRYHRRRHDSWRCIGLVHGVQKAIRTDSWRTNARWQRNRASGNRRHPGPCHSTQPYCPWSNGTVERSERELLHMARVGLSDLQVSQNDMPELITLYQTVPNDAPSPSHNNFSPKTAFTGRPRFPPMTSIISASDGTVVKIFKAMRGMQINMNSLTKHTDEMHRTIHAVASNELDRSLQGREKVELAIFVERHYVPFARKDFRKEVKL